MEHKPSLALLIGQLNWEKLRSAVKRCLSVTYDVCIYVAYSTVLRTTYDVPPYSTVHISEGRQR